MLTILVSVFAILAIHRAAAQVCTAPPVGMIAWYPGDGNANDIAGTHHGTLKNGATFAPGMVAQAFSLDGVDDYVEAPDSVDFTTTSLTLDAWVKPVSNTQPAIIVSKYDSSGPGKSWILSVKDYDGSLRFAVYGPPAGGRAIDTPGGPVLLSGQWNHIAATFDFDTQAMAIYVNGVQTPTVPTPGFYNTLTSINDSTTPVRIGVAVFSSASSAEFANYFNGLVDEVEIFGRALAASEIQAIYNAGSAGKCKATADTTPPTFGSCPAGGPFLLNSGFQPVGPIAAQDPESGIKAGASALTGSVDTSTVGQKSVIFAAVNNAGLSATKECEYQVQYNFSGFFQPIDNGIANAAKAGQTIPVKWRLTDAAGLPVSDTSSFVSITSGSTPGGCGGSADAIEMYSVTSTSGLQYLGTGNWQYNWKTTKSYAGQCRTLTLNLNDGTSHTASFVFY